jgi:hypothetical protein
MLPGMVGAKGLCVGCALALKVSPPAPAAGAAGGAVAAKAEPKADIAVT